MTLIKRLSQALKHARGEPVAVAGSRPAAAEPVGTSDWSSAIPQILAASLIAATLILAVMRFTGFGTPPVVAFDIIKYANAQRAVASKFLTGKATEEVAPLLLDVSKRTREVIAEVAGPGTLVVIRQSVVQGEMRDITDEVLTRLNLPTNVPTADPAKIVLDVAPTMLGAHTKLFSDIPAAAKTDTTAALP